MTLPDEFDLSALDDLLILDENAHDRIACRIGLSCTLFVAQPQRISVRERLARCGDEYLERFGASIRSYMAPAGTGRVKPYPKSGVSLQASVKGTGDARQEFSPFFSGAANHLDAALHNLDILASGTDFLSGDDNLGHLSATLPASFALHSPEPEAFKSLLLHWCNVLKPRSGYAGLALIQSVDDAQKLRTSHQIYMLGLRFPGLDIDNPSIVANHLGKGIKCVNWLTVLGEDCLSALGGRQALADWPTDAIRLLDFDGGVIVQAGPSPQVGDVNRNQLLTPYRLVAERLKAIRMQFPPGHSFIRPKGHSGTDATNRWLSRFE